MPAVPNDPLEAALLLAAAFERAGISYAVGGALAYGLWSVPRATVDVDINLFVGDAQLSLVVDAMHTLGIVIGADRASLESEARGMFNARFGPFRLDLFTPSIPFSQEAERTRVRQSIDGQSAWFLAAEALCVFKLLFFRPKDVVDLERLIAVQGQALDLAYVRRHVVEMMGEGDERVQRWDELTGRAATAG